MKQQTMKTFSNNVRQKWIKETNKQWWGNERNLHIDKELEDEEEAERARSRESTKQRRKTKCKKMKKIRKHKWHTTN